MRTIAKVLALSIAAAALAGPVSAASMHGSAVGGAILPPAGGGSVGGSAAVGGNAGSRGFTGGSNASRGSTFAQQRRTGPISGQTAGATDWRRHHCRHGYYPGSIYGYDDGIYGGATYDDPNFNQCSVYRKIYNARGQFIGWRQVDVCAG
jgi:hypothetical protein